MPALPLFLTKNRYGSMVVTGMDPYERLMGNVEAMLDAADRQAASATFRHSHDEPFGAL